MVTRHVIGILIAVSLLASCSAAPKVSDTRHVDSADKVANIFVSAYPVIPWSDISTKLEPKHALSTAEARKMAATATQEQVGQFLSLFSAGLGIGLPTKSVSQTTTTGIDGASTLTRTGHVEPGAVPSAVVPPSPPIVDGTLSSTSLPSSKLGGLDAATELMQGTAVYQLAAILDNQLSKALKIGGYEAYLVTFQVNVQPFARNLPYDAYINLTLLPSSWYAAIQASAELFENGEETPSVVIYPLIVADAIESSNVTKSVEAISQAALTLSGIVNNTGMNSGLNNGSNTYNSLAGVDRNSLISVGRVNNNSLRIRLGAQYQGSSQLALTTKTQNVSVVVFIKSSSRPVGYIDKLTAVTFTEFRDAETGQILVASELELGEEEKITRDVKLLLDRYGMELHSDSPYCRSKNLALSLLRAAERGDYFVLDNCLLKKTNLDIQSNQVADMNDRKPNLYSVSKSLLEDINDPEVKAHHRPVSQDRQRAEMAAGFNPLDRQQVQALIARLQVLRANSRESRVTIALRPYTEDVELPSGDRLVVLADDKKQTLAILKGALNQRDTYLDARLKIELGGKYVSLPPNSISVNSDGNEICIAFPSLATYKLLKDKDRASNADGTRLAGASMELTITSRPPKRPSSSQLFKDVHWVEVDAQK